MRRPCVVFLILALVAAILALPSASIGAEQPPTSIFITVPDYVITRQGSVDTVEIPGGSMLVDEQGRPLVPCLLTSVAYPADARIHEVRLVKRSIPRPVTGLALPTVINDPELTTPVVPLGGWYPDKEFMWAVQHTSDGAYSLNIEVYPFVYDPDTHSALFYKTWEFAVSYTHSDASIASCEPDQTSYRPGDTVRFSILIANSGAPQDFIVGTTIRRSGSAEALTGLPLRKLTGVTGTALVDLAWNSGSAANGRYEADIALMDVEGHTLDSTVVSFPVGSPLLLVTKLEASPQRFKVGDTVSIQSSLVNQGSAPGSGRLFLIVRAAGLPETSFVHTFENLETSHTVTFTDTWSTTGSQPGVPHVITCYATCEAGSTPLVSTVVSTNASPAAAFETDPSRPSAGTDIAFDGSSSTDTDGTVTNWQWNLGNGIISEGKKLTARYARPGTYAVTLTVVDNNGGTGSVTRNIVVTQATPPPPPVERTVIVLTIDSTRFAVNGEARTLDAAPIIREGRTLLPIRPVAEALGAVVGWDGVERKASITLGATSLELWIGNPTARVNGRAVPIDPANTKVVPLIVPPGRTMLPLRFVGESLGCLVEWNASTRQVTVTYPTP